MIQEIFLLQNPWRKNKRYNFDFKKREIFEVLTDNMDNELLIRLVGSRQVGKSSLLFMLIEHLLKKGVSSQNIFYFNMDDFHLHSLFATIPEFIRFLGENKGRKYVFIDEVQRLNSPGLFLKEVFDLKEDIKIIYSGSSQLEVKAKTREHLVGRARTFVINRLSFNEYLHFASPITKAEALEQVLIYGSYPAVAKEVSPINKKLRIKDVFQAYVQKDLVDFIKIKNTNIYNKFLIRLAMQTGDLLNIHAISKSLAISRHLVEEYLNILEQTFICKRIFPFHRNYAKEITKTPKLYFLDLGLRNFILNDFRNLEMRDDAGKLFENFWLNETLSKDFHTLIKISFWRTTNQTEIDFIVQNESGTTATEIKWSNNKRPKSFQTIEALYPEITTQLITRNSFLEGAGSHG